MTEEMIDIVDENDKVIDTVPRSEMRVKNLRYRISFFLVFNTKGELLICKRSKTKDIFPGLYEIPGGTLSSGETYEENARREMEEELGIINPNLEYLFTQNYEDAATKHISKIFKCIFDGEIKAQKEEVESCFFISLNDLKEMIEKRREEFCPDRIPFIKRYLEEYHES
tara:strand:+ start:168 stop:674 length:507 start_codon:yes stop_codon:yes gene_type:complete